MQRHSRFGCVFCGAPDTIRTYDLFLRREALYPAELRVQTAVQFLIAAQEYQSLTRFASRYFPLNTRVNSPELRQDLDLGAKFAALVW